MQAHKENPRVPAGNTRAKANYGYTNKADCRRFPPYSKHLSPSRSTTIWVCIGSEAWGRAQSETWHPRRKVMLPQGDEPGAFKWAFVAEFADTAIIVDGEQPGSGIITALVRELLVYVDSVLFLGADRVPVKFSAQGVRRAA